MNGGRHLAGQNVGLPAFGLCRLPFDLEKLVRTERDHALDEARAAFNRQTPRTTRKQAAHQLRDLGCTLDQIGAVFHVSKERIRQDLLWNPAARKA